MSEERLNEIKDSVNFQRKLLWAHNVTIVCVDEAQELIKEIDRLNNIINKLEKWIEEHKQYQLISERYIVWEDKLVNKLKTLKENNNNE